MEHKKILVVDDDKNICDLLELYLTDAGFEVSCCGDGSAALQLINDGSVDLVLLDVMLPVINGWEVCKMIKRKTEIPVILLTARDMLEDKIQGFEMGADDYIVKPFAPKEVIARINARLKNAAPKEEKPQETPKTTLQIGDLLVDLERYEVFRGKEKIDLTPREIQLLYFLMKNKNRVFSRDQLLEKVWNYEYTGDTRTVDVHIKTLRKKIESQDSNWLIRTVWGVGYKFEVRE